MKHLCVRKLELFLNYLVFFSIENVIKIDTVMENT